MKDTIAKAQRVIYDDPARWGKEYHSINLERARMTAQVVPGDAKKILEVGSKLKKHKLSILVIDDKSPDGTGKIVKQISKKKKSSNTF